METIYIQLLNDAYCDGYAVFNIQKGTYVHVWCLCVSWWMLFGLAGVSVYTVCM